MSAPEWAPGHIVGGKYTVRAELGRGERMRTYAALTEPSREVVLRAVGGNDAGELEQVAARLAALSALPEASVLRVLEVGRDDATGARFVATDRSRSPSLASLVELCPLTPDEGLAFAGKLAAAIDAMHKGRVVHLGLRPTNVFVGPMPSGSVEIADAGVPRLDEARLERMRWTAPEATPGPAADVFSAALLIFFAITGKPYFKAEHEQELAAEISGRRVPASQRAKELGVTLPASVDAAFSRALATDPGTRPRSAGEFVSQLGAMGASAGKSKRPPEVVAPPRDLMASLIESELQNVNVSIPPLDEFGAAPVSLTDDVVLVESERPRTSSAAPALGPPPLQELPPARSKRRIAIVVGIVAAAFVLLLVASAVALARKKASVATQNPAPTISAPTVSASPSVPAPVASADSVGSVDTDAPTPPPPATVVEAASSHPAAPLGPLGPDESELRVVCVPSCDVVMVDRRRMTSYPDPMRVPAGQHGIGVSAKEYWGDWKLVVTKGGQHATVTFKLRSKSAPLPNVHFTPPTPPTPPTHPAATTHPKKPCGKFLKRCD